MKEKRTFTLIKNKNYLAYWFATAFSMGASNILQYLLALYILKSTGSSTIYASVLSVVVIPRIIMTPIAGVIGDRYKKIRLMTFLNVITSIIMFIFSFHVWTTQSFSVVAVFSLVIILEIVEVFYQAPESSILPEIIGKDLLEEATVLSKIDDGIVFIASPMIAVTSYNLFGIEGSLFLVFGVLLISTILNFFIKTPFAVVNKDDYSTKNPFKNFFEDLRLGIKELKKDKFLYLMTITTPIVNFSFAAVYRVVLTYMFLEIYDLNDYVFGLYKSVTASMTIVVPFLIMPIVKKLKVTKILKTSTVIISIALFLTAILSYIGLKVDQSGKNIVVALITILDCTTIASVMPMHLAFNVYSYREIKDEYRSRIMSVMRMLSMASVPLGSMFYGYLV